MVKETGAFYNHLDWSAVGSNHFTVNLEISVSDVRWLFLQVFQVFNCATLLHVAEICMPFSTSVNLDALNKMFLLACFIARLNRLFEWNEPLTKFFPSGAFLCSLPCSFWRSCLNLQRKFVSHETPMLESISFSMFGWLVSWSSLWLFVHVLWVCVCF